jgi:hypothetical protein
MQGVGSQALLDALAGEGSLVKVEMLELPCGRRPVGQSVLVSGTLLGRMTSFLLLSNSSCDERTALQLAVAAGTRV